MGSRLGRVLLVAAAVSIVAAGVAAALVASSDDDGGESLLLGGKVSTSDSTEASPTTEGESPAPDPDSAPDPDTGAPTDDVPADDAPSGGSGSAGGAGEPRKTRFPREREGAARNDPPARVFTVPPAREFSGTGNARLGTVKVRAPAVVKWTTTGRFELRFGREAFPIIAPSPSGQLVVPAFDFELVRVTATGRWRISITPQR